MIFFGRGAAWLLFWLDVDGATYVLRRRGRRNKSIDGQEEGGGGEDEEEEEEEEAAGIDAGDAICKCSSDVSSG